VDEEAPKKSLTDAMKKCLSLLGVCSDVFMGEFDDRTYVEAAQLESDLKKADNKDAELVSKIDQFNDFIADKINAMKQCPNIDALGKVYGLAANKAQREAPILGIDIGAIMQSIDACYHETSKNLKG